MGCRPCSEILFKYTASGGVTVGLGINCKTCLDKNDHSDDTENKNMACETCVSGAKAMRFYNRNRKDEYGVICIEFRAQTAGSSFTGNPGLDIAGTSSSPASE